jgi:dTDP-4-dehydrorhamnose reductase
MGKVSIAVLGANGQLGQTFRQISENLSGFSFDFFDKNNLDILDKDTLRKTLLDVGYKYVINCAAYTKVDLAESEPDLCMAVNVTAVKHLTEIMEGTEMRLVHFSSDYVYHRYNGFPLIETDTLNPQSVYANSKADGEMIIRNSKVPALILRSSWIVSPYGHNFVKTMVRLGQTRDTIHVVNDQLGAITYATDLAKTVMAIIEKVESCKEMLPAFNDTYNYANEGITSWFDIASEIMKLKSLPSKVIPISTRDYPTAAARPQWSVLSKKKIKTRFNIEVPHWHTSLKTCLESI